MTEVELVDYFNEHVVYELLMLRYSKNQLETISIKIRDDQLLWNAMFAAFNVSARNLYDFLKGDRGNMSATDYRTHCPTFKSPNVSPITGTLQMLNTHCFHMGKTRTKVATDKVTLERIIKMYEWVESNMNGLAASFGEGFKSKIDWVKADWAPIKQPIAYTSGPTGPMGPIPILRVPASILSATTTTGSGVSSTGNVIKPKRKGP
jgi:hypothetical protein